MKYFDLLPKVLYDNDLFSIRNLFYKFNFVEDIPIEYLYNYTIKDGESLETISFMEYNDPSLWWLLAIINDMRDIIFDMPLDSISLKKIATDQSTIDNVLDLNLFSTNYDILEAENDNKRIIKILKNKYLSDVLINIIREIS